MSKSYTRWLRRVVPIHARIEDSAANDSFDGLSFGLNVPLKELVVKLLNDGQQGLSMSISFVIILHSNQHTRRSFSSTIERAASSWVSILGIKVAPI